MLEYWQGFFRFFQLANPFGDSALELEIEPGGKLFNLLAIRYIDDCANETNGLSRCIEECLSLRRYPMLRVVTRMNDSVFDVVETVVYTGQRLHDGPVNPFTIFRMNALQEKLTGDFGIQC